jgi:hypothetical protein
MSKWTAAFPFDPPKPTNLKSWWAEPKNQASREAFQRQLVSTEISRMNGNQRFGGAKSVTDKGIK